MTALQFQVTGGHRGPPRQRCPSASPFEGDPILGNIIITFTLLITCNLQAKVGVSEYKPIKSSIHDPYSALGVRIHGGSFKTDQKFKSIQVKMTFIKDGKIVPNKSIGIGNSSLESSSYGQVSIKIIDLDHLSIKGAPTNSYRFHYTLLVGDSEIASRFTDIPKAIFDVSKGVG